MTRTWQPCTRLLRTSSFICLLFAFLPQPELRVWSGLRGGRNASCELPFWHWSSFSLFPPPSPTSTMCACVCVYVAICRCVLLPSTSCDLSGYHSLFHLFTFVLGYVPSLSRAAQLRRSGGGGRRGVGLSQFLFLSPSPSSAPPLFFACPHVAYSARAWHALLWPRSQTLHLSLSGCVCVCMYVGGLCVRVRCCARLRVSVCACM